MKRAGEYSIAAQVWALREYGEVGPRTFRALMAYFGNLPAILEAGIEELQNINGLGEKKSAKISESYKQLEPSEIFINSLESKETGYATIFDDQYPPLFMELHDPPPIIFYRGTLPQRDEKAVAIVGSHEASGEGIALTVELASMLAGHSVSIVSGLARGIDASAHIGALKGKGRTYAVLGSGFNNIYPEENRPLALEITKNGGLISEYPPDPVRRRTDEKYIPGRLMARNRLTAGLSQAVIIGELFSSSNGTLDTAAFCHEVGKLMFVLIDGCDRPDRDQGGVEKVLSLGAIPITMDKGIDLILKSLV